MFGLSWTQIGVILLVGVFVLGPERIPTAIAGALGAVRKVRAMVAGAQADTIGQLGPEIAELRRQLAELQELAGISELRELHPQRLLGSGMTGGPARSTGPGQDDQPLRGPGHGDVPVDGTLDPALDPALGVAADSAAERVGVDQHDQVELQPLGQFRGQ